VEESLGRSGSPIGRGHRCSPQNLPVKVVLVDLPETQKTCSCCGKRKVLIGQEDSAQLDFDPGKFSKRVTRWNTYACPEACRGQVKTAPLPVLAAPTERGRPTASLCSKERAGRLPPLRSGLEKSVLSGALWTDDPPILWAGPFLVPPPYPVPLSTPYN